MAQNVVCCTMVPIQHLLLLAVVLDKAEYYHIILFLVVIGDVIQASIAKHLSVSKYAGIGWKMDSIL